MSIWPHVYSYYYAVAPTGREERRTRD